MEQVVTGGLPFGCLVEVVERVQENLGRDCCFEARTTLLLDHRKRY